MSVKIALLKSGESVIADIKELISEDKVCGYLFTNPHKMQVSNSIFLTEEPIGSEDGTVSVTFSSWILFTSDNEIPVRPDWVVTIVEPVKDIKKMYIDAGANNNALVIPVGIAFENAYKLNPNIKLHKSFDGSHPSLLGTYLASCVVFASITQKSPRGIDYNYFNEISDVDKNFLQDVAHMTVETFFDIKL